MNFTFDTESDFGVDYGGVPSYDFGSTSGLDTGRINDISYGSSGSSGSNVIGSLGKIFEALDKAKTYKSQNSSGGNSFSSPQSSVEQVGKNMYLINRAPKKIPVGTQQSSGGGGLFGGLGGAAGALGTAAGVFGPLGAPVGALVGKGIDAIFG